LVLAETDAAITTSILRVWWWLADRRMNLTARVHDLPSRGFLSMLCWTLVLLSHAAERSIVTRSNLTPISLEGFEASDVDPLGSRRRAIPETCGLVGSLFQYLNAGIVNGKF